MGKKGSKNKHNRRKKKNGFAKGKCISKDYISQLPNDVLVSILSRLTVKEAARTSILSSSPWRHLWEHNTNLIFDDAFLFNRKDQKMEGHWFRRWVNHVLSLCKSQAIEEFRVIFPLCRSFKRHVDKWLKFALSRELQCLELDFSYKGWVVDYYAFPFDIFSQITIGFKSLKTLSLTAICLVDEAFAFILSNFPLLEQFTVCFNAQLSKLKVTDPSLKLKYLDIQFCRQLISIEICNVNLVSFKYKGKRIRLCVENVPFLVEFYIGGNISRFLNNIFSMPSSCWSQVETLTLHLFADEEFKKIDVLSELTNLKKFKVKMTPVNGYSLLSLASVMKVAPYLHEFVMEISWFLTPRFGYKCPLSVPKCPHSNLKKVELAGYCGRSCDLQLVMFFFENAVALEKMIVAPYSQGCRTQRFFNLEKTARGLAKQQLIGKAPRGVELTIL